MYLYVASLKEYWTLKEQFNLVMNFGGLIETLILKGTVLLFKEGWGFEAFINKLLVDL